MSPPSSSANAIALLEEIAHLMRLKGENVFKVRAFERASEVLSDRTDLEKRAREGTLTELDGVGKGISEVLTEYLVSGTSTVRDELKQSLPEGLIELAQIPGLGPKKAMHLIEELGVRSVRELEYACKENRLLKIKGFGPKLQSKILESIEFIQSTSGQFRLDQVLPIAEALAHEMAKRLKTRVELTGAVRRRLEVLQSIDLLIEERVEKNFSVQVTKSLADVDHRGVPVNYHLSDQKSFGFHWAKTSSSPEHWKALGSPSSPDFFRATEKDFYEVSKTPYIEPVFRETGEEVTLARKWKGSFSEKMLSLEAVQGVFHFHTTRSDGANSLEEMVLAAKKLGYRYLGVSDHSQSAFYAQGLKKDDLKEQEFEVRKVQEKYPDIRLFWGIESDILADGSLDYPDDLLERFDFVIASVHSRFQMDRTAMTERVIQAIRNPYTRFVGHLTGRLLLGRKGYELDMDRVIREAAKYDVAIELNAHPQRLDIDWRHGRELRSHQTLVSVNPDAHEVKGFEDTRYGVWMGQKALLTREQVVNTWSTSQVESWLARRKK